MTFPAELIGIGVPGLTATNFGGNGISVVALGSSQSTAAQIKTGASLIIVTGGNGTLAVTLPAVEEGSECWVFNSSSSNLPVFPPVGAAIATSGTGLGTANSSFTLAPNKLCLFKWQATTQILANISA